MSNPADLPRSLVDQVLGRIYATDPYVCNVDANIVRIVLAGLFDSCDVREDWGVRLVRVQDDHPDDRWCFRGLDDVMGFIAARAASEDVSPDSPAWVWRVVRNPLRRLVLTTPPDEVVSPGEDQTDG